MNDQAHTAQLLKIVGIVGSPHKDGMTAQLAQRALAGAETAGAQTTIIYLIDEEMEPCHACGGDCWNTRECVHDPASGARHAQLQDADGLVMATPVYCWQMSGLMHLCIDKMRWNTGSVLHPRNPRSAFGIASAGGSGTGCVLALQALYRYLYNWAFHGITPLPVTRFNYLQALEQAYTGGQELVRTLQTGVEPFASLGAAEAHYETLPYMNYGPLDELRLIVQQQVAGLAGDKSTLAHTLRLEASLAEDAWLRRDREAAAEYLSRAYDAGTRAWNK
ncbi:MAG: flavodoxin family protein [Anaerolineae bacterium]